MEPVGSVSMPAQEAAQTEGATSVATDQQAGAAPSDTPVSDNVSVLEEPFHTVIKSSSPPTSFFLTVVANVASDEAGRGDPANDRSIGFRVNRDEELNGGDVQRVAEFVESISDYLHAFVERGRIGTTFIKLKEIHIKSNSNSTTSEMQVETIAGEGQF